MRRTVLLLVVVGLLLTVGNMALAGRVKDGQAPTGEGERLDVNSEEYIAQDEPSWIRIGYLQPVYRGSIPDAKKEFGIRNLAVGSPYFDIYIDGIQLHSEIERSVVWGPEISYPAWDYISVEYDVRGTWNLVQLPAGYFEPGVHNVTIVASIHNPNSTLHRVYGGPPPPFWITVHVSD